MKMMMMMICHHLKIKFFTNTFLEIGKCHEKMDYVFFPVQILYLSGEESVK